MKARAAVILLWGVLCWAFFQFLYPCHFFYQEQNQLFLLSTDYIATYLQKPAWAACLVGDFLTQFYYYLYAGPAILTIALLTVGDLARRALQQAGLRQGWAFALALVLMTLEAFCCLRVQHRLSAVAALGGGLAIYLVASILYHRCGKAMTAVIIIVASVFTYWLFGYGLWAMQVLLIIEAVCQWRKGNKGWHTLFFLTPLALAPFIAFIAPRHYYLTPSAALAYPNPGRPALPDLVLERDFAVDNEYHLGNYHKVEQMVEEAGTHTDQMLFFYNLVKAQKGELPDNLLRFVPNQLGTFYAIGPETPRLVIINMNELYWALGDMTLTERAAMMTNVFSPRNRNVRMVKRLAECNMVSGDTLAGMKYLRLLRQTVAYSGWAKSAMEGEPKACRFVAEKRPYINKADTLRLSDNLHMVMMELLDSNPSNIAALDYILCSTLLLKDMENFKRDYDRYCYNLGRERVKPLYQQALMIYLAGTNAPEEEWRKYIHDERMVARFAEYNRQRGNTLFKDTYWYYFDTAKKPQP